ncbi:hypothetical protein CHS0354_034261 [Potamilus streckersoni]|uniref:Amine oxidase n=1 Tax=Potamilus streckersoni TaxID=2493646 RepID=A0AAE0S4G2_9BIVA|nr:hypothetical protein CHS0354_034261 [Potamilus streckersoni]
MAERIFVLVISCLQLMSVSSQKDTATQTQGPTVLILGAGMAGITAAKALHDKGYNNFIILDGSNRVGGRIKEVTIGGFTVEGGAAWIHAGGTNPLHMIANRFNLSYVTSNYEDYIVLDSKGQVVTNEFDKRHDNSFDPAFKFYKNYSKEARNKQKPDFTMRSALLMGGWNPRSAVDDVIEFFNIDNSYSYGPEAISGLHAYPDEPYEEFNTTDDLTVKDSRGYSHILRGLCSEFLPDGDKRLRLNEVVTHIEQIDGGIVVHTKDNVTYSADYVIVTFSLGVLQHDDVRFSPPLPFWKREAINQFQQALLMHIYLQFAEKFWDDHEFLLYASERRNYYNIWQNVDKTLSGSKIFQVSVVGDEVRRLERLNDTEIIHELLSVLMVMYGGRRIPQPVAYAIPRWYSDPLFRGAFSNWPPGYTLDTFNGLQAPVDKIYFAGDYGDRHNYGYVHGSYLSALRVAEDIDMCIRNPSFCVEPFRPKYDVRGCTYQVAKNYNAKAKEDDGSCTFVKCQISASVSIYYETYLFIISAVFIILSIIP